MPQGVGYKGAAANVASLGKARLGVQSRANETLYEILGKQTKERKKLEKDSESLLESIGMGKTAGSIIGAIIGTAIAPGVGTAIGAGLGSGAGSKIGEAVGPDISSSNNTLFFNDKRDSIVDNIQTKMMSDMLTDAATAYIFSDGIVKGMGKVTDKFKLFTARDATSEFAKQPLKKLPTLFSSATTNGTPLKNVPNSPVFTGSKPNIAPQISPTVNPDIGNKLRIRGSGYSGNNSNVVTLSTFGQKYSPAASNPHWVGNVTSIYNKATGSSFGGGTPFSSFDTAGLADAIATAEGFNVAGSIPKLNNNPGNLVFANQKGATLGKGGFAKFKSANAGFEALRQQIELDKTRDYQFFSQYIK